MKRKIIKQGLGGNTIFLPIGWVRRNNLKAGDEIDIQEKENDLLIIGDKKQKIKTKEIIIGDTDNNAQIRTIIASLYKAGYQEIVLHFEKLPPMKTLNALISTFTGLEIVSQNKNTIRIKSFLQANKEEVEPLIIKIFQMIKTVFEIINNQSDNNKDNNFEAIQSIRQNIHRIRDH